MARNAAFEILYKEYYVRVFGLCRRILNSSELAQDATQEAFMRAFKSFRKYDSDQPFWNWIAAIANNHCIELLRQRSRRQSLFGEANAELENIATADAPALQELVSAEHARSLSREIANLPDKYRVPLVLAYFNRSSYDEIADQLEISRNHVGVLLLRAKQMLRANFERAQGPA